MSPPLESAAASLDAASNRLPAPQDVLQRRFELVAQLVRESSPASTNNSNDEKLRYYGLYKHITQGPCNDDDAPSILNVVARSKFMAWKDCQKFSRQEAMQEYINLMTSRNDHLGEKCREIVQEDYNCKAPTTKSSVRHSKQVLAAQTTTSFSLSFDSTTKVASFSLWKYFHVWMASFGIQVLEFLGVKPLIPRGRLDLSYWDLVYALGQCGKWWQETLYHCRQMSDQIRRVWEENAGEDGVVAGLSVRSLLDLYLLTKKFPKGSQVIMVPPISVPGMVLVLKYHDLEIVPIDMPPANDDDNGSLEWYDFHQIQEAITPKSVAIMLVHPFGRLAASVTQMQELRRLADEHGLELWEDCAECFMGLGKECYKGSPLADVRFFSFGMIKTSTALGGGIATFRDLESRRNVERLQWSLPQCQTTFQFLCRVLLAMLLNYIADSPWRVGLLVQVCAWFGLDFDRVVTNAVRGFRIQQYCVATDKEIKLRRRQGETDLIRQIRKRPCHALLALMYRRFSQSKTQITTSVRDRTIQCNQMQAVLATSIPKALLPYGPHQRNTYWSFPIICDNRDDVSAILVEQGFDVVSGASQLGCVTNWAEANHGSCPVASKLMNSILYVPISSQQLPPKELQRLADGLKHAVQTAELTTSSKGRQKGKHKASISALTLAALIPIWFLLTVRFGTVNSLLWMGWLGLNVAVSMFTAYILWIVCLCLLRFNMASLYLEGSTAFAEHCDMIDAGTSEQPHPNRYKGSGNAILSQMPSLQMTQPTAESAERAIILTGATGFIGSMLLHDLLWRRKELSLDRLILICRGRKGDSATSRISALLRKPMFSFLTDEDKERCVEVLNGDVSQPSAGLSDDDFSRVVNDPKISHVFHCAAAVGFTQELPDAARSNISSSLAMQQLTSRLPRKGAKFVHISTAFVHGSLCGSVEAPLSEGLFPLDPFNPEEIYQSMLGTQFYASKAMADLEFANSYTLSKCVCEHLLLRRKAIDTLIIRPSIVGPAVEAPWEGWAGDKPTTIVAAACLHLLNQWNIWYLESNSVSYIPVDVLSRFILAKSFGESNDFVINADTASSSNGSYDKVSRATSDSQSDSDETLSVDSKPSSPQSGHIFNATWDTSSDSSTFSWLEFSVTYLQLGCVLGYFSRGLAYLSLLVSAHLSPRYCDNSGLYHKVHALLVRGPIELLIWFLETIYVATAGIKKVLPFLDLPLLFFPFVQRTFHFRSGLVAPSNFDSRRYVFSMAVAAHRFISDKTSMDPSASNDDSSKEWLSTHKIGGQGHVVRTADFLWAVTQPRGGFAVRFSAFAFSKILQCVCSIVTVDLPSFRRVLSSIRSKVKDDQTYLIMAPTHRSFFDFILISYVLFAIPELQLDIPYIIAADEFQFLPFLGWFCRKLRALYIRRGRGQEDPTLTTKLSEFKANELSAKETALEVFLEGTRSRDRRFVEAKTGLLKCLDQTGGNHVIVPITINYERVPEQENLSYEASGSRRKGLNLRGLLSWLIDAIRGRVKLGKIHMLAGDPLPMLCETGEDFAAFAKEVQIRQQEKVLVSDYHFQAAAALFELPQSTVVEAMMKLGCQKWPTVSGGDRLPELPENMSELMSIILQVGHLIAPMFTKSHPGWTQWLSCHAADREFDAVDDNTRKIHQALGSLFDAATSVVTETAKQLQAEGFLLPTTKHLLQLAESASGGDVPAILLHAAVQMHLAKGREGDGEDTDADIRLESAMSHENAMVNDDQERVGFWGFVDSGFVLRNQSHNNGQTTVAMKGDKYALSGCSLSRLLPFMESEMNIEIDVWREFPSLSSTWFAADMRNDLGKEDAGFLQNNFSRTSFKMVERLRHGTGHSQEDVFAIRDGPMFRIPDAVVWPTTEDEVVALVQASKERGWCLIPFGGGTNVSSATRCPDKAVEPRPIISVDMKEMQRILWVNDEDGLAHVEAGIIGRDLVHELRRCGYTMGHEPDSIEFSTLGGWIATKASGMKRSRYGNIEDIVKSVRVVTSKGILWKGSSEGNAAVHGRVAEGFDLQSLVIGSEGCLGIITSAVIRIWPLPEVQRFDSFIFPSFEAGLSFVRGIAKKNSSHLPSSVRLLDNAHFRLGQALRPDDPSALGQIKETLIKAATSAFFAGRLDPHSIVCATICYEGSKGEVAAQEATVKESVKQNGGVRLGPKVGKSGYDLTFMIAYLRDFAMTYHVLGESFETFCPWSKIETLIEATKKRIRDEHRARLLPGTPFVGCRVTQLYHEGACLYFYLCISFDRVQYPSAVFSALEAAARDEILKQGGSLSHHHGIGKHRAAQWKTRVSPALNASIRNIKEGIDEDNIFGARNGPFAPSGPTPS